MLAGFEHIRRTMESIHVNRPSRVKCHKVETDGNVGVYECDLRAVDLAEIVIPPFLTISTTDLVILAPTPVLSQFKLVSNFCLIKYEDVCINQADALGYSTSRNDDTLAELNQLRADILPRLESDLVGVQTDLQRMRQLHDSFCLSIFNSIIFDHSLVRCGDEVSSSARYMILTHHSLDIFNIPYEGISFMAIPISSLIAKMSIRDNELRFYELSSFVCGVTLTPLNTLKYFTALKVLGIDVSISGGHTKDSIIVSPAIRE